MSGTAAGIISIFTFMVGVGLATTLVKNASGTAQVVQAVTGGFSQDLSAAMGNSTLGGNVSTLG